MSNKLYVAYVQGVYRHETLAAAISEELLYPKILEWFKDHDDYHSIGVELLEADKPPQDVSVYRVNSKRISIVDKNGWRYNTIHGDREVSRSEDWEVYTHVDTFHQECILNRGDRVVQE